ncbi:MAG: gliding motility-associated C-terminal domain-containing protein [Bacteroidota bacterium]
MLPAPAQRIDTVAQVPGAVYAQQWQNDTLWIGGNLGFYRYNRQGEWKYLPGPLQTEPYNIGTSFAIDPVSKRKFAGFDLFGSPRNRSSLFSFANENDTWRPETNGEDNYFYSQSLAFDADNTLWVSDWQEKAKYRRLGEGWINIPANADFNSFGTYYLTADRLNQKWFGNQEGLFKKATTNTPAVLVQGATGYCYSSWYPPHSPDSVYFGNQDGLFKIKLTETRGRLVRRSFDWSTPGNQITDPIVMCYTADSINARFMGGGAGLMLERGRVKKLMFADDPVFNITVDKFNNKWVGTFRHLYKIKDVKAEFSNTPANCALIPVNFSNRSSALWDNLTRFRWDFGDGIVSTENSPTHRYLERGTYNVRLIAVNADSIRDTMSTVLHIGINAGVNEGRQIMLYEGDTIALHAYTNAGDNDVAYARWEQLITSSPPVWQLRDSGLVLGHAWQSGLYRFISGNSVCEDTILVQITLGPKPPVGLGTGDGAFICRGDSLFVPLQHPGTPASLLALRLTYMGRAYPAFSSPADTSGVMLRDSGTYTLHWQYRNFPEQASAFRLSFFNPAHDTISARAQSLCNLPDTITLKLMVGKPANYRISWKRNDTLLNEANAYLLARTPGTYKALYQNRDNNCRDSAEFILNPTSLHAVSLLTSNSGLCPNDSVMIQLSPDGRPLPPGYTWHWEQDGRPIPGSESRIVIWAKQPATYFIRYQNPEGCTGFQQVILDRFAFGRHSFTGAGATLCPGDTFTETTFTRALLNEQVFFKLYRNGQPADSNLTGTFRISVAGVYRIRYRGESSNCSAFAHSESDLAADSFIVNVLPIPAYTFSSGSRVLCPGETKPLSLITDAAQILWFKDFDALPNETGSTLNVIRPGTYFAKLSSAFGCFGFTDPVLITPAQIPAPLRITGSATFCNHDSTLLQSNGSSSQSLQWTYNGSDIAGATASTLAAKKQGLYTIKVLTSCGPVESSGLRVGRLNRPSGTISVKQDRSCSNDTVILSAPVWDFMRWNTGANGSEIKVISGGNYSVQLLGLNGCDTTLQYNLVLPALNPALKINYDTTALCIIDKIRIWATPGFKTYLWNSGETTPSILINPVGNIGITVTDDRNCSYSQTLRLPRVSSLDTLVSNYPLRCPGDTVILSVPTAPEGAAYKWSTGQTLPAIKISEPGTYKLNLEAGDCSRDLSFIFPAFNCPWTGPEPYYPNVISPNGDRYNETFVILYKAPKTDITIINRWGETVFYSSDYANDWHAADLPAGVYYLITHSPGHADYKGWVQVLR